MTEPVIQDRGQTTDALRVLIVDDHDLFRSGLRNLLEVEDGVEIIGEARGGQEALRIVRELTPDVVVMDLNMPGMSGVDATRHISPKTVKNHISNILMKLQIDNRIQAAVYAVRSGIV